MNPDLPSLPSSPQEERLTALLLGELDPAGAAAVRAALQADPELARLHDRLARTLALVRDAEAQPAPAVPSGPPPPESLDSRRLSPERRDALLQVLRGTPAAPVEPAVTPAQEPVGEERHPGSRVVPGFFGGRAGSAREGGGWLLLAAAAVAVLGLFAVDNLISIREVRSHSLEARFDALSPAASSVAAPVPDLEGKRGTVGTVGAATPEIAAAPDEVFFGVPVEGEVRQAGAKDALARGRSRRQNEDRLSEVEAVSPPAPAKPAAPAPDSAGSPVQLRGEVRLYRNSPSAASDRGASPVAPGDAVSAGVVLGKEAAVVNGPVSSLALVDSDGTRGGRAPDAPEEAMGRLGYAVKPAAAADAVDFGAVAAADSVAVVGQSPVRGLQIRGGGGGGGGVGGEPPALGDRPKLGLQFFKETSLNSLPATPAPSAATAAEAPAAGLAGLAASPEPAGGRLGGVEVNRFGGGGGMPALKSSDPASVPARAGRDVSDLKAAFAPDARGFTAAPERELREQVLARAKHDDFVQPAAEARSRYALGLVRDEPAGVPAEGWDVSADREKAAKDGKLVTPAGAASAAEPEMAQAAESFWFKVEDASKAADKNLPWQDVRLTPAPEAKLKVQALAELSDGAAARPAAVSPPVPQPERLTAEEAVSTFSLNVADVSYKLAEASLERGVLPAPASIRVEEFINAFDYRDPDPALGAPVALAFDRARSPFAHQRDLLRLSVRTAARGREAGRPMNLVLLLDNSGSMERADRVRILREAIRVLSGLLKEQDRISVVSFARSARLWVDGLPGPRAAELPELLGTLVPEGGTNLEEALRVAYETALRHFLAGGINRVVVLTDGAANLGEVRPDNLRELVESQRRRGIALDGFGIGWEGLNDDLLEVLTRNGDGRYGFLNSPEDVSGGFATQLAGALQVAASDVKVQVEFNPARVSAWRQVGYARHQLTREQFRDNTVDAAELGAAESGTALYAIETLPQGSGPVATVRIRFKVPATGQYEEHAWTVPYSGVAPALDQAAPSLRLAATAAAFGEWLSGSPFAAEAGPDRLVGLLEPVLDAFAPDPKPARLVGWLRAAQSLAGR